MPSPQFSSNFSHQGNDRLACLRASSGQFWDAGGTLGTPPSAPLLTTKAINVQVNLPAGQYVGAGRDSLTLPLCVQPAPTLSGETYSWSVLSGPGNGTFDIPLAQNPNFRGTIEGHVTTKVTMTYQGAACPASKELVVVRIDELTDSVDQEMDQIPITAGGYYSVPFSGSGGELQSVLVAAPDDSSDPYQWESHYYGRVNHITGEVLMTFIRPGPYLLKINRQAFSSYVELWVACAASNEKKESSCKTKSIPKPSAGLILISTSANDNGFLTNAQDSIGSGNYTPVANVQDAIDAIKAMPMEGSVAIIDHGRSALQNLGAGNKNMVGKTLYLSEIGIAGSWTERFIAECRNSVTTLPLFGCSVAAGANGVNFLQGLANRGTMTAKAYDKQVFCTGSFLLWGGNWLTCVDATLVSKSPTP